MSPFVSPARCYPEARSQEYVLRGRKKIPAEQDKPTAVETKYLGREFGHEWRERVAKAG